MAPLRRWKYGPRYLCADAFICMWENEAATNSHTWCAHIHTAGLAWATVYILFIDYFLLLFFPILSHIYTSINSPFLPSLWNLSEQLLWSVWLWGCRHFVGLKNKVKAHLYHRLGRNFNFTNAPFNIAEHTAGVYTATKPGETPLSDWVKQVAFAVPCSWVTGLSYRLRIADLTLVYLCVPTFT